ncbi:NAD(P)H-dependent glycerol-3-phosphate dehydrogenase [Lutispora saccharofermentans]|uniref:Glycerol-3-phosphate dehydrogenase [NAD(P)+] n=1 Tax=Lutispora saccharofermentans TaxID=3024236 RepID=A0ABT1NA14_9FIRM|nr:NAD(P)H-dependent glycerol-3-phosphate dehydrogenase [Lutispora saccharofermentans]MCQ1528102.1 NAD(P)H-dependent glycerol-3-phosphate dehydrogenase [Lutispora saccharofermentans]
MIKVSVIGSGSWGTANAISLASKGLNVKLWVRNKELLETINEKRENTTYLPDVMLPDKIHISNDLEYCCRESDIIVLGTPSHAVRETVHNIRSYLNKEQVIVNLAKGIENDTLCRMSEVIEEYLPDNPIAVLSGPNHAEEVARNIPSATVVSSKYKRVAEFIQDTFMTPRFRVYTNPDIVGVELGGALKNVIALGAGISDGLGFGDNTKTALMTRGIVEIARLGVAMGARQNTFNGLSGVGDLIVTCTSMHSRNRRAGIAIGQGKTLEEVLSSTKMVVEGVRTTKSAYQLSKKIGIEMPITEEIYGVLFDDYEVRNSVINLMTRNKTHEMEDLPEIEAVNWKDA